MPEQYVIVGNGIAGATAAEIVRTEDANATITVLADDPFPVYYRPALKDYLAGRVREDKLWARSGSFYQDHNILFLPERVVGIQAGQHVVQLQSGRQVAYSRLLLANGARASRLTCPGLDVEGVTTLRTVADYQAVVKRLAMVRRVVVTGSGTLALETVETLRHRGYAVTHLIRRRTLWSEVLDATASDLVLQQERRDGVDVRLEEELAEVLGKGQVTGVVTTKGTRIACEMVLIAIGVEPIIDFIKKSGIGCGRGVKVDGMMRTNAPDIYAAGDVLETTDSASGRVRVIGQWYPAVQQARVAAYSMLGLSGQETAFRTNTFYNATFLYGLDFASVGLTNATGYQEMLADPQPRTYQKVLLKDGVPVGMLALGNRKRALAFKRAIDHGVNLQSVAAKLFAEDFSLNKWLDRQGVPPPLLGVSKSSEEMQKTIAGPDDYATVVAGGGDAGAINLAPIGGAAVVKPQPQIEAVLIPVTDADALKLVPTTGAEGAMNVAPTTGAIRLAETRLTLSDTMLVGRQMGAFLLIDHGSVSRRHAELKYTDREFWLSDLGSSNGTFVNNVRLAAQKPQTLKDGDTIRFGTLATFALRLTVVGPRFIVPSTPSKAAKGTSMAGMTMLYNANPDLAATARVASASPMGQPLLNDDGSLLLPGTTQPIPASVVATFKTTPALIVNNGNATPLVFSLNKGKPITLGRDKGNDIPLADIVASRRHAEVFPGPEGFYIRDLGSSNGVLVNQTNIDNPYVLKHGDRIMVGSSRVYYMDLR